MAEISVAILGLKRIGTSVGLALKRHNAQKKNTNTFRIEGYDTSRDLAKAAKEMGAVDKVDHRPDTLVRDKDIVVIALPYGEVEGAYELIGPALRAGVVVVDMSPLAQKSLQVAAKYLSGDAHIVCAAPIVNPEYLFDGTDETARATEDYFDKGLMLVMPSAGCIKDAVNLASDFARILGAMPNFYDPAEYDALTAGTETLPSLLGMVMFHTLSQNQGWGDFQRLTNPAFGALTRTLFDTHSSDLRDLWLDSDESLIRHIDTLIETLRAFRVLIATRDVPALENALETASARYETWVNRRMTNNWQDAPVDPQLPTMGSIMGGMFGRVPGFMRRGAGDPDEK